MAVPRATVLLPTFDHGPTIRPALASVLDQTERDLEVLVIGDGAPDVTRAIVAEATARDPRVRLLDHPKGENKGELWRHEAVRAAAGEAILFMADDDLWLPDHAARMLDLLRGHDFAHCRPAMVRAEGTVYASPADYRRAAARRHFLRGAAPGYLPPACTAHTAAFYARLPHGWRPAPAGIPMDDHMWRQVFAVPGIRVASGRFSTHLAFPSPFRREWTIDRRVAELEEWLPRTRDAAWRASFEESMLRQMEELGLEFQERVMLAEETRWWRLRERLRGLIGRGRAAASP